MVSQPRQRDIAPVGSSVQAPDPLAGRDRELGRAREAGRSRVGRMYRSTTTRHARARPACSIGCPLGAGVGRRDHSAGALPRQPPRHAMARPPAQWMTAKPMYGSKGSRWSGSGRPPAKCSSMASVCPARVGCRAGRRHHAARAASGGRSARARPWLGLKVEVEEEQAHHEVRVACDGRGDGLHRRPP